MADIKAKKVLFKNRNGESLIPYIGEDYVKQEDMVEFEMREIPCVVETYVSGTSWYRVWSDGWCEQGGETTGGSQAINFLKGFTNANYNAIATYTSTSTGGASININKNNKTNMYVNADRSFIWQACGYIA